MSGQSTVRKTQFPGGHRMTREANADGRKAAGNLDTLVGPSADGPGQLVG